MSLQAAFTSRVNSNQPDSFSKPAVDPHQRSSLRMSEAGNQARNSIAASFNPAMLSPGRLPQKTSSPQSNMDNLLDPASPGGEEPQQRKSIKMLSSNLNFNPAMMMPGGAPPPKVKLPESGELPQNAVATATGSSFERTNRTSGAKGRRRPSRRATAVVGSSQGLEDDDFDDYLFAAPMSARSTPSTQPPIATTTSQPTPESVQSSDSASSSSPVLVDPQHVAALAVAPASPPASAPAAAQSAEQLVQPVDQPIAQLVEQPTKQPAEQAAEKPVEQPTEHPAEKPTEKPAERFAEQPAEQSMAQPAEQSTTQPAEQPATELAEKPTEQPTEHPTEKPVETPTLQPQLPETSKPNSSLFADDDDSLSAKPAPKPAAAKNSQFLFGDEVDGDDPFSVSKPAQPKPKSGGGLFDD
eukprot:c3310_g1_i1.p1 GENE.c3310_g1_i1~~c3310_g1_i1.p1  ORF type:complete len:434 (-),score=86.61 c3310_g1_i1:277-1512(-)